MDGALTSDGSTDGKLGSGGTKCGLLKVYGLLRGRCVYCGGCVCKGRVVEWRVREADRRNYLIIAGEILQCGMLKSSLPACLLILRRYLFPSTAGRQFSSQILSCTAFLTMGRSTKCAIFAHSSTHSIQNSSMFIIITCAIWAPGKHMANLERKHERKSTYKLL